MPDDWFEEPRTAADIPAIALQHLAPLPQGKGANAETTPAGGTAPARTATVDAGGGTTPKADLLSQMEPEVQPSGSTTPPTAREFAPASERPLILEGGLAPITEALIKILALKDRQGALSEDKAFELLGAVRLL